MCIQLYILNISQIRMLNSEVTQPNMVLCCLKCPSKDWPHVHLPCFLSASCVPLPTLVGHLRRKQYPRWFHTNTILHCAQDCKIQEIWYGSISNPQTGYREFRPFRGNTHTKKQCDVPVQILPKKLSILQHNFDYYIRCLQIPVVVNGLFIHHKFFFHNMG